MKKSTMKGRKAKNVDNSDFELKKIGGESLAEWLNARREAAGFTIEALAAKTRVQEKYLRALEAGDGRDLPEAAYQRLFIKVIAGALGESEAAALLRFEESQSQCHTRKEERQKPPQSQAASKFLVAPKIISAAALITIAVLAFLGLGYEILRLVAPPELFIESPLDGEVRQSAALSVSGRTERGATLYVNGELVYLKPDGSFEETINLRQGLNIIKISVRKIHSDERVLYRHVLYRGVEAASGGGTAAVVLTSRSQ
jgi:transcriptional regulator with XRE-family HTH domain